MSLCKRNCFYGAGGLCGRSADKTVEIAKEYKNAFSEKGKIKVKKGDYLELDNCILEQE